MTKVSNIFDNMSSEIIAALPTYVKIPNPYTAENNNELYLEKGFGLAIGPGNRRDLEISGSCGSLGYERVFNVVLVNQVTTTDHNTLVRETIQKSLLEDFKKVRDALESNNTLTGQCIKVDYDSDNGIEILEGDRVKFLALTANYIVLYQDTYV